MSEWGTIGDMMLCQLKTTAVSFYVFVYASYKLNENISFSSLKMTGPWVVSLQKLFLIGNMTF